MKRKLTLIFLSIVCALCLCFGLTACGGNSGSSVNGTYYLYESGSYDYDDYIVLKSGDWHDSDDASGTYTVSGTSIVFYTDLFGESIEYMDGTVSDGVITFDITLLGVTTTYTYCQQGKAPSSSGSSGDSGSSGTTPSTTYTVTYNANGGTFTDGSETYTQTVNSGSTLTAPTSPTRENYTFAGWATSKNGSTMWQFGSDKVTSNITLYASWSQKSASILSVDDASIDGTEIYMLVDHNTDSVSLSSKVVCSSDSTWKLYYDQMGQTEIPTKVAASLSGSLYNGENVFYIVVTSTDGTQVNLYTLTVYRSYAVTISYYNGTELLKTETAYTGYSFTTTYTPSINGYTFNYWKTSSGSKFTEETLTGSIALYADTTVNTYTVTYDVNGGDELAETTKTVTYDSSYTLAVPTKTHYTFAGWYIGSTQLTDEKGKSLAVWNYASNKTLTAKWTANDYTVTLNLSNSLAGTVTGAGDHAYNSSVTIKATTNDGYTWVGWYNGDELLTTNLNYTFTMGTDVTYTAKWTYYTLTTSANNSSAGTVTSYSNAKITAGKSVTITATTKSGYTFVGWYNGDTQLSTSLSYTFTMPEESLNYTAKWSKVTITANNASAGSVTSLNSTYKVGDEVTITATTNTGYTWVGWYTGETLLTSELSYTFEMFAENATYTAQWSKVTIEINIAAAGAVTSLDSTYKVGDKVTITATTNTGYTWIGWYNGEMLLTSELSYTFDMSVENAIYTAQWTYYTLTTSVNDEDAGTVTSYSSTKVTAGESVTLTATTKSGYTWIGWYNGETLLTSELSYTFYMSAENTTYTAHWTYYTLTTSVNDEDAGTITNYSSTKVTAGASVTLTATTNSGYTWVGWYNGETLLTSELTYTFEMSAEDLSYTAKWTFYTLTTSVNNEDAGTITSYSSTKVTAGESVTITAATKDSYPFIGWFNGDRLLSSELSYTFTMPTEDINYMAKWMTITITVTSNNTSAGTVSGLTTSNNILGNEIIVTATEANLGYTWLGWYNGETKLTEVYSYTFTISETNAEYVAKYEVNSEMSNFKFTSTTDTCTITGIEDNTVTEIVVPDYVTSISSGAFKGCASLISITLPFVGGSVSATSASSSTIFGYIFGTSSYTGGTSTSQYYTTYYIPTTLTSVIITGGDILNYAFYNCSMLSSVTIGSGLTSIGNYVFRNCTSLTGVTIPDRVTSIGSYAFSGCTALASTYYNGTASEWANISFGNSTANPLNYADNLYLDGTLATNITLEDITFINDYTFYGYTSLTSITIGSGVTSIGSYAFYNCTSLKSVTIGNSVTSIGNHAFYNCTALTEINFNATAMEDLSSSKYIFAYAGQSSNGITITIGVNVTKIPAYLFDPDSSSYASNIMSVVFEEGNVCKSIGSCAFRYCTSLKSIILPDSVTSIGSYAFHWCSMLSSVTIGSGVTSIGNYAFGYCTALTEINFNATAMDDLSSSNYVFANAGQSGNGITVTIGANVTKIPAYLFCPRTPDTTQKPAPNITSVVFKGSSVCKSIGSCAFRYCTSLKSVIISDSITSIDQDAFNGCTSLTSVTFEDTTTWYYTSTSGATSGGTKVTVTNTSTAATYLNSTYASYYWYKL